MKTSITYLRSQSLGNATWAVLFTLLFLGFNAFASEHITQVGGLAVPRKDHTATVLADGRVLIVGGENAAGTLASAEIYDPVARTFSSAGAMSTPRVRHAATRLADGKVLITGGRNSSGTLATAEIYDPSAPVPFRALASTMGSARQHHTATLLANGRVLVAGGDLTGTGELYHPATESFASSLIAMIESRSGQTATTMPENSVLLAGGGRRSVEVFDLQTSAFLSWSAMLNESRTRPSAITAADGSIYFVGGEPAGSLEKFNLLSGSGASFPLGAASSAATQLANGRILVTGPALASLFAPATGTLAPIANAGLLQRSGQTVTELPSDKQILVAGGVDAASGYITPAALYNPARIVTDKADYYPDEPVIVYGFGWKPGEAVDLYVVDNLGWIYDSSVTADANGQFTADPYFVVLWRHLGVTFDLTAIGAQSGLKAKHTFTDGDVQFSTAGLPVGTSITVNWSYSTPTPTIGSTTFSSPGPKAAFSVNNRDASYTYPATVTNAGITYKFVSGSPASPFNTGPGGATTTTVTGTYKVLATRLAITSVSAAAYGSTFSLTIQSQDGAGIPCNVETNTNVSLSLTAGSGALGGTLTGTINAGTNTLTITGVTYSRAENGVVVTAVRTSGDSLTSATSAPFYVLPRSITVTAVADTKIYDGTDASTGVPSITLGSLVAGDTANFVQKFESKNVGTGRTLIPSGSVVDGNTGNNYLVNFVSVSAGSITAKALTGSFSATNRTYDGTTASTAGSRQLAGVIAPDDVTLTGGTATFDTKQVGTDKTVTLTGATLAGAQAGNYNLTSVAPTTANITARPLTVGASGVNKIYDGTTSATVTLSDDRIAGDALTTSYTTASFADKIVGTGKAVSVVGISISGSDSGNYTFNTTAATTANITPRALVVSATGSNKIYDGNTSATVTLSDNRVAGDVLSTSYTTATFANKHVGNGKSVGVSGISIDGADAGNYTFNATTTTAADITPRALTIGAVGIDKVYDRTTTASVTLSDNRVTGDALTTIYTAANFADKNVGNGKPVSVTGISISGDDAGNYTSNSTAATTANITPFALTGSITAANKVYDATTAATLLTRTLAVVFAGDDVTYVGGTATFADKNVGAGKTVTATGLSLTGADATNYTVNTTATTTADITALGITGSITANDKVYDGNNTATIATRTLSGVLGTDVVTYIGGTATFDTRSVGNGKVVSATGLTLNGADASNYTVNATATTTASITHRPLAVSATGITKTYDGSTAATVTLTDNRVAGDIFTTAYTSAAFDTEHVGTGKTVSVSGISITGTDAGNYTFNTSALTTADIIARALTVSATGINKVYDGTATATVTLSDDRVSGDTLVVNYGSAQFVDKKVATNKAVGVSGITVTGADAGNYTFNTTASTTADITARPLTVTAAGINKVYNGNTTASVTLSDNRISGDVFTTAYTSASFADKNVGGGKPVSVSGISISGVDAGNYACNTSTSTVATITPRSLLVTATGTNKVYDSTVAATVMLSDDRISGDVLATAYTSASFLDKHVGTGKTVNVAGISLSGTDASNYSPNTSTSTTASITPRPLAVTASASNKVYDGNTSAAVTLSDDRLSGDVLTAAYTAASFADKNVGTGKPVSVSGISLSGVDAGNYTPNTGTSTTASITPRTLVVSAAGVNKIYDGNNTATVTLADDRVAGDQLTTSYASATFNNEHVGTGKPVSVSGISIVGNDAGNYTCNTTAGTTADITAKALTVSATGINKVYDGTPTATVTLSDDRVSGDTLVVSYGSAQFVDKKVATNKAVGVSGITVTGADAGNYTFNSTASTTADITSRPLTVTAAGINKVYNGNTTASVTLSDNRISGDVFTTAYTAATFADKNVGNGKPVSVTGLNISGDDAGNYTSNSTAATTASITPFALTGSITAANKVYDATTAATLLTRTLAGKVSGDDVSYVGGTATFANKNAGAGKTVTATGLSLSGGDAVNYTVNTTATTTADIAPLAITGSITAASKVYDGNATATIVTRTLTGVLGSDVVNYVGGTAMFDSASAGIGKLVSATGLSLSGADMGNYTVNPTATTNADITPANATIEISDLVQAYNGTARAPAVTVMAVPAVPAAGIKVEYNSGNPDLWVSTLPIAVDVYSVRVTITDPNYAVAPQTALFVIYDPTAGFVTGGGWINSPAGASTQFPNAVGKANFGFNSKYQKGANVPTGQTEFQFQAGSLNFKSTSYEWLVVQGTTKAQFKGVGTVNGTSGYGFMLTALDGDNFGNKKPDAFRIKIWLLATGVIVYDNKMGSADNSDDATTLGDNGQGGGSIVIHDGSKK